MAKPEKAYMIQSVSFAPETGALTDPKGKKTVLRPQTAQVLGVLAASAGRVVTKDALMAAVWPDTHVTDDSLVQCISEIRRSLGTTAATNLVTVPKQGYRLDAIPAPTAPPAAASSDPAERRTQKHRFLAAAALLALLALAAVLAYSFTADDDPAGTGRRIAVLPFVNLNDDPEQDYLAVGLAEDLLIDLSRSGGLTVISRSASFGYRDGGDPAAHIHRDLGATHLVDGSLQRDGDRIRISVQLVDAATGNTVWAERFDRRIDSLFDLQDEVRLELLNALSVEFDLSPRQPRAGTTDVTAYDLLLQGRYLEASESRVNTLRAIDLYKRAIDLDPSYSDAYARLANMYEISSRSGWSVSEEGDRALALEMAERAVRLDPRNPFARWTRGRIVARLDGSDDAVDEAVSEFKEAIRIDPNYADAHAFLALVHVGNGALQDADESMTIAFEMNPDPPSWYFRNRGIISYFRNDYAAAVNDLQTASDMNKLANASGVWLAVALADSGQVDEAEWILEENFVNGIPDSISDFMKWNANLIRDPDFVSTLTSGLRAAGMAD